LPEDDPYVVRGGVVDEWDPCSPIGEPVSIEFDRCHPSADTVRVLDDDLVPGRVVAEVDLVPGQARGMQGSSTSDVPRNRNPRIDSTPAWYIQPAEPVYQVQPPRPTCGGSV